MSTSIYLACRSAGSASAANIPLRLRHLHQLFFLLWALSAQEELGI